MSDKYDDDTPPHRIRIFGDPRAKVRCFAVTEPLSEFHSGRLYLRTDAPSLRSCVDGPLTPRVQELLADLLKLKGIASVNLSETQLDVEIGTAFNWSDVTDAIVELLMRRLFAGKTVQLELRMSRTVHEVMLVHFEPAAKLNQ